MKITGRETLAVFTGRVADVQDAAIGSAPCSMHFQTLGGWRPRMRLGRTPGAQTSQLFGHKVGSVDAIPEPLRDRLKRDHPGWLRNPGI